MRASIILVVFNGVRYLGACMEAVLQETGPQDEVILVDNASTDGSANLVKERWPGVRLIQNETNRGFAAASNQGAAAAQGDALVFLNQDTQVQPGWLGALVAGFSQDDEVGLTTSKLLFMAQPEQINLCGQELLYTGMTFGRGTLRPAAEYNAAEAVGSVSGASFAIRRSLWEQLGGFDASFFMYFEETDLSWRAGLLGYTCWYMPGSIAYHDAGLQPSPAAAYYAARNRAVMVLKHWKWPTLLCMLPGLLATELVEWAYLLRLGRGYAGGKLRACGWQLAHAGQILQSRRQAQAGRQVSDAWLLGGCAYRLSPRVLSINRLGSGLIWMANLLLWINYRAALIFTRWLKL